jgi:hypothetical protein
MHLCHSARLSASIDRGKLNPSKLTVLADRLARRPGDDRTARLPRPGPSKLQQQPIRPLPP